MRAILAAAAMAVIGGAADAAVFDYYGRSYWLRTHDYNGEYLGGTLNEGLRVRVTIDEGILGPLVDTIIYIENSTHPAIQIESNRGMFDAIPRDAGPLQTRTLEGLYLAFDASGAIIDWQIEMGESSVFGWHSTPYGDYFADDGWPIMSWSGHSFGPGKWGDPSPVPLPASAGLLVAAIAAAGFVTRRRRA